MNAKIEHRGPDGEGIFQAAGVALGHRMLKIIDLGPENVQPMRFREYAITYNGEIYNFRTIREELKKLGYSFQTNTDTEVILAAYDAWRENCVKRFVGMWAFVLYDEVQKAVFCSRDRFGIKPLFYTTVKDKFLIGSEIKQFTIFRDFQPRLNNQAAFDFLYASKLNTGDESMFENVKSIPAGCNLLYDLNAHTFKLKRWYDLRDACPDNSITFTDAVTEFHALFQQSISEHLYAQVRVGSCLSGGLDTTSIVGMSKKLGMNIQTFSSCFLERGYNEINYIDTAVHSYHLDNHKVFPRIQDLLVEDCLGKMVYQQDQPIIGGSFFSEYKVYETAAQFNNRVMLSGQGADEYLGGYGEFYEVFLRMLLLKKKFSYLNETARLPGKIGHFKNFIRHYLPGIFASPKMVPHEGFLNSLKSEWLNEHIHPFQLPAKSKCLGDLSIFALLDYSLPHQLHSEDRSSMLFSIESRLPFLDHRLVEFTLSLPDNFKLRNGTTKFILRESMKSILPKTIYNRQSKLGFPGPEESLFREQQSLIKGMYQETVEMFPNIFTHNLLNQFNDYGEGKISYDNFFFRVLAFGVWANRFNINFTGTASSFEKKRAHLATRIKQLS